MKAFWIIVAAVLIAAGAAYYIWQREGVAPSPPPARTAAPAPTPPAGPKFPVPVPPEEKPLPKLGESDAAMVEALGSLFGPQAVSNFFQAENLVRHIVVMVDNLPRKTYPAQMNPMQPPRAPFRTQGQGEGLVLAQENFTRYTPYVKLAESVDMSKVAAVYTRFYPLFQQAYVEQGYPNGYFNDRLIEVIDHLLAAPEVKGPIKLTVPKVLPEFADPELEGRSSGQKLLIRMGPENAARVKKKLSELRGALVKGG